MSSRKCHKFRHTVNRCSEEIPTCARCSNQGQNKDKLSAPAPKSNAITAQQNTKFSQETARNPKTNTNHPDPLKTKETQTTVHTKTSLTESDTRTNLLRRSRKTPLTQQDQKPD